MRNLEYFGKLSVIMVSRLLVELLRTNCYKKISSKPLIIKNTRNLFKFVQKRPFLIFAVLVVKF